MQPPFRLFGAELSPYSIKVRAYLRFKGLEHEWISRSADTQAAFQRYAKLPLVPVLVDAQERAWQDSTPIIENLEALFPEPSITPGDDALRFVAALIEDYADEWVNKAMFHYRWTYPADQESAAERLARMMFPDGEFDQVRTVAEGVRARMTGRLHHVGSNAQTAPVIEGSYVTLLDLAERQLQGRPYLFGGRPSVADFGLAAQLAQLLSDPTPGAVMRERAPKVAAWCARTMQTPAVEGDFEPLEAVEQGVRAFLAEIGQVYLPWLAANAEALREGEETFETTIKGAPYAQSPQKYALRAYGELKRKRQDYESAALRALLEETGCAPFLPERAAAPVEGEEEGGEDGGDEE